ncbi:Uncharacterised protein [Mycobacteroides abscessus subsp. massiliense]|nr:Uncharacterised protein [Mycobacteroides abscessus subsp. massiliense]
MQPAPAPIAAPLADLHYLDPIGEAVVVLSFKRTVEGMNDVLGHSSNRGVDRLGSYSHHGCRLQTADRVSRSPYPRGLETRKYDTAPSRAGERLNNSRG